MLGLALTERQFCLYIIIAFLITFSLITVKYFFLVVKTTKKKPYF